MSWPSRRVRAGSGPPKFSPIRTRELIRRLWFLKDFYIKGGKDFYIKGTKMFIRKSKLSFWAEFGLDLTPKGDHSLTLETLTSKFEFSFVASIHFLQK